MELIACVKCGKLFNYVSGPRICQQCNKALEEKLLRESGSSSPAPNLSEPVVGSSLEKGDLKVAR